MSTYVPIQTIRITSDTATITFTGIPQTYTDLVIVGNVASTGDDLVPTVRVGNGTIDTGSNYSQTTGGFIAGAGIASFRDSNDTRMRFGRGGFSTTQPVGVFTLHFQNYSNTTTNKTVLARNSAFDRTVSMCVGTWRSTSAINTIQFTEYSGATYVSGSTFTLYGIGSGSPKAFGGNEVRTDGTFWYHIFRSSGQFEPVTNLSCDYLVVAGGGGAGAVGANLGGGGGGGGLRSTVTATGGGGSLESALSVLSGIAYTVTVGAGGAAGTSGNAGTNGGNSIFSTITSTGGGGGGSSINGTPITTADGRNGGSGGGAALYNSGGGWTAATVGNGTANQGYNGGAANASLNAGGGGGGAGEAGNVDGTSHGGDGVAVSITGSSVTYAGGGGGGNQSGGSAGTGGLGGGGNGGNADPSSGTAGTTNTGGGGGGSRGGTSTSGSGGSGIVIVRYAV